MAKNVAHKQAAPLVLDVRKDKGSRKTQFLRATGQLPGVVYGLGKTPVSVSFKGSEFVSIIRAGAHTVEATLEGKTDQFLIQDVQYDYLQSTVEHVDLLRIDISKKVTVSVALDFRGTPKGTKEGGVFEVQASEIEVEVSPLSIPGSIRVNIDNIELHGVLHAKDITLPEGAKLLENPEKIIAQVRTVKEEVAADAPAGAAEPEVIGKKKEEEGAESAAPAKGAAKK